MCFISAYSLGTVFIYQVFLTAPNFLTEQSKHHQAIEANVATSFLNDRIYELVKNSFTSSKLMHRDGLMRIQPKLCQ